MCAKYYSGVARNFSQGVRNSVIVSVVFNRHPSQFPNYCNLAYSLYWCLHKVKSRQGNEL